MKRIKPSSFILKKVRKNFLDKFKKNNTEMIGIVRAPKKIAKLPENFQEDKGKVVTNTIDFNFGEIRKDTSTFVIVLETLLESNILLYKNKGEEVDIRLTTLNIKDCLNEVIYFHNNLVRHNRIPFCFNFYKEVTNYCIQLLETPREEHKNIFTPRTSTGIVDRWPTAFQLMRPLFFNARDKTNLGQVCDQIIRSLLNVHRLCEDFKDISLESITKPSNPIKESFLKDFEDFVSKKFLSNEITGSKSWNTTLNIDQSKNGPNGMLSYKSSGMEAFKLIQTKRFNEPFKKLCDLTDNQTLYNSIKVRAGEYQNSLENAYESNKANSNSSLEKFLSEKKKNIYLRRLTGVPDSGHKSRTIAICDYWTQTILEPTEKDLIQATLKLYPHSCDYYSHSKGFNRMFKRLKVGDKFYDCSNWTDRFPVELQEIVYKLIYNSDIAKCWMELVVKCPWFVKDSYQTIRYSRGQGMGTRGSFQIAQLTSCLLMDYIYVTHYKIELNSHLWAEVGDDMGCHDPDGYVLKLYTELDIPINLSKTKIPTSENLCMEYVSRNVNQGKDVSRISARNCLAIDSNLLDLTSLVLHINERTVEFDFNILFKKMVDSKKHSGVPRWKFPSWIILFKTLAVNDIIYPNETLSSILLPLEKALRDKGYNNPDLRLFSNLKVTTEFRNLLRLIVLDDLVKKILTAGKKLQENHIIEKGNPFPLIDPSLVDAIVRRSLAENEENIPKFPWEKIPDVDSGCAIYHYMLALSNQKYHKFVSELFGSGILNDVDLIDKNSNQNYDLLNSLEQELSKVLISVMPKQVFGKKNTSYHKIRLRMSYSYSLLKYFSNEETVNQVFLKFKHELEEFKELGSNFGKTLDINSYTKPELVSVVLGTHSPDT